MAFGVFGGISFVGFLLSFGIRSYKLEDDEWVEAHEDDESDKSEDEET